MGRPLPAVQLDDVPRQVRRNGMTSSLAFLGSKTGKEVGVCFWRVDPALPRFTVVFKRVEDRDNWAASSPLLRDMQRDHGVRSSLVLYDREREQVVGGEREKPPKMKLDDNNNNPLLARSSGTPRKSESIKTVMKEELQDLEEIFGGKMKLTATSKDSSPPVGSVQVRDESESVSQFTRDGGRQSDLQSPVSSGFCSSESDGGSVSQTEAVLEDPPPPPLRLPRFAQQLGGRGPSSSNLLQRLVGALEIYMTGTEVGLEGRERSLAQAVADSWEADLGELEKLYEQFLSDLTMNRHSLRQELANIYSFRGSPTLTRAKAIELTELFIINAGTRVGMDLDQSFREFISENISKYQVSKEEMLFIASRNKLDLTSLFKSFQVSPNISSFRKLLQDKVHLSGSFFQDFSQVLIDFFLSKTKGGHKESSAFKSKPQAAALQKNDLEAELKKLNSSIERDDVRNAKSLVAGIIGKVAALPDLNLLEEENCKSEAEVVARREELQEEMKAANLENKTLRSQNSALQSKLSQAVEAKEKVAAKFSVFRDILQTFLSDPGQLPHIRELDPNSQESDEVASLISGLRKIKDSVSASHRGQSRPQEGSQRVQLALEAGQTFSVFTNRSNNLCLRDVEKVVGQRVVSLLSEDYGQLQSGGGYINCPLRGWGDRLYWVNKEAGPGSSNTS